MNHGKKLILLIFLTLTLIVSIPCLVFAQNQDDEITNNPDLTGQESGTLPAKHELQEFTPPENHYYQARVMKIIEEVYNDDPLVFEIERFSQKVEVKILEGPDQDQLLELSYVPGSTDDADQNLKAGEKVLLIETEVGGEKNYYIADRYRLNTVLILAVAFFILVVIFTGWRGITSLLGLGFTIAVIMWYILPQVIAGHDPFTTFLIGGFVIAIISIYLGHGFNRRTSIAVVSTLITLTLSIGIALLTVSWAKLFGLGSEEAFYVQVGTFANLNLRGLLLGGIIIGILGVLDDITTAQAAAIEEIHRANPKLNFFELAKRGLSVGHEHIVSLVNTLALAYIGASFPLLLLFSQAYVPIWVALNSERVIEEIVRTLIGSSALVFAVPITTYLAAWFFSNYGSKNSNVLTYHHH